MRLLALPALLFALPSLSLAGQNAAPPSTAELELHADVPYRGVQQEARLEQHDFVPGRTSGPHLHHGTEQAYVLRGTLEVRIAGQPTRIVHAGETFQVARDVPHEARNIGSDSASLLVSYVMDKGAPWKIPLPSLDAPPPPASAAASTAGAQTGRVELGENDAVHMWRTTVLPNQPLAMHRHDHARVLIPLTDGTMHFVDPAGHVETAEWKRGQAYLYHAMPPGAMHSDVNAGSEPIEVVVVELKRER